MELTVKNKFFSLGGASKVLNENKEEVLKVKGKVFSITRKKFVKDLNGNILFMVRNKFWKFIKPKALIYGPDKKLVAKVIRDFRIRQSYTIEGAVEEIRIVANGAIGLGFDNTIWMGGKAIGRIKRPYVAWTDTFTVEFDDPADSAFLVALVIAIDVIQDRQKADASSN